jgi:phosphoglycerate dehydrogenase-like enzyme
VTRQADDNRAVVALLMPSARRDLVFPPASLDRLERSVHLIIAGDATDEIAQALPTLLPGVDVGLTGWGTPALSDDLLACAPRLRLIAHAAGSIRPLVSDRALERGLVVCHAADVIAQAVAEFTLGLFLLGLRRAHLYDRILHEAAPWKDASDLFVGHLLSARTVGLIGCGLVARRLLALLRPFGCTVLVYDPYVSDDEARSLEAQAVPLHELLRSSDVVSIHAPSTAETRRMIGREQLALLRDGTLVVNTARSWPMDEQALIEALRTRPLWAALDVFDAEPLPVDSPLCALSNVLLTPHKAGETVETYGRQGQAMIEEVERFLRGEELRHRVRPDRYDVMA